jgi:hypothetical protein
MNTRGFRTPEPSQSQNVAEFVCKRTSEWGPRRWGGRPGRGLGEGEGFHGLCAVRHEEMAAFMVSAHAKFTGQTGLCYATSGPCAIHSFGVAGSKLRRFNSDGSVDHDVELPVSQPTMCAFAGEGLATIYVTSASDKLTKVENAEHRSQAHFSGCRPEEVVFRGRYSPCKYKSFWNAVILCPSLRQGCFPRVMRSMVRPSA